MTNPNDEIREKILRYLYDNYKSAATRNRATVSEPNLVRTIERQGYNTNDVVSNFLYLLQTGWIKKENMGRGEFKTTHYIISDIGINHFEGASIFQKSHWTTGINVTNVQGVTVIGNNNYVRNEYSELYRNLELLSEEIRKSGSVSDEDKINYTADINTLKEQLAKPKPAKEVIRAVWTGLKGLSSIEGVAQFYERTSTLIEALFSNGL